MLETRLYIINLKFDKFRLQATEEAGFSCWGSEKMSANKLSPHLKSHPMHIILQYPDYYGLRAQ